jgi:hypothetical protein
VSNPEFVSRNVILRIVKPYPDARNHVYMGKVVSYDGRFIGLDGCVLHFGRASVDDPTGGLSTSARAIRWVALQRIEYVLELPDGIDPYDPKKLHVTAGGSVSFADRPDTLPD